MKFKVFLFFFFFNPGHCSLVMAIHEFCRTDCRLLLQNNVPPARHAQECTLMQKPALPPSTDVACKHLMKKWGQVWPVVPAGQPHSLSSRPLIHPLRFFSLRVMHSQISLCFIPKLWSTESNVADFSMDDHWNFAVCEGRSIRTLQETLLTSLLLPAWHNCCLCG